MSTPAWGIFDSVDECWLGTNDAGTGPRTWADRRFAEVAENVWRTRFEYPAGRLRVLRVVVDTPLTVKDEVTPPLSAEEATDRLGWNQLDVFADGAS